MDRRGGKKGSVGNGWGLGRKGEGELGRERECVGNGWGGREGV